MTKLQRKISGGEQVNGHTQQTLQFDLQASEIEQRCTRQCIHQQVEIAAVSIGAMQNRAENSRIRRPKPSRRVANGIAPEFECD